MKALVLTEYNHLSLQEVPTPEIGPTDVLVRVKACAICGSDVHGMDGSTGRRIPPIVMGHEAAGQIAGIGSSVRGYAVGDRVTFDSTIYCGECFFCRQGLVNLCDNRKVLGVSCGDYRLNGAFAEYVAIPQHILYRIPDAVTDEQAAMVEPLAVALHAVRRSPVRQNETAVVVGTGMIGLLIIQLLKQAGPGRIIAIDPLQEKLDLARRFGADACFANSGDSPAAIQKLTRNRGADVAFEAVGLSDSVKTAISSLRKGGSLVMVGNLKPTVDLPLQAVVTRQLTLYGTCASAGEYPDCMELIAAGKVDVNSFISAVAPLEEGATWFRRLHDREPGLMKVVLKP